MKILIIATSHSELGTTGHKTGLWLEELAAPYYSFLDNGIAITLASPKGGAIPMDPKSDDPDSQTEATLRFKADATALAVLQNSVPLSQIHPEEYDAVFVPGGHGPMWDIADNPEVNTILESFTSNNKPIGSVCHGVAALVGVKNAEGQPLVAGKKITSFTNTEEELVQLTKIVPFLLETRLKTLGADYSKKGDFAPYTVVDGKLVTGQNPASSVGTAEAILQLLK